jgi:hypothetical protein
MTAVFIFVGAAFCLLVLLSLLAQLKKKATNGQQLRYARVDGIVGQ